MNCLSEALGIAMPGNGTILATSPDRREFAKQSARQLMELIKSDIKPRDIACRTAELFKLLKPFLIDFA